MLECEIYNQFEQGIECVNTDEMGKVVDILKDLAMIRYYHEVTEAMEHNEESETDNVSRTEKARQMYSMEKSQENFEKYTKELMMELTNMWDSLDSVERTMLKTRIANLQTKMG
jgi:uncharacterized heparinase superfamily protein